MKNIPLHWKIIIGMVLGIVVGLLLSSFSGGSIFITNWIKPFGTIFINSLKEEFTDVDAASLKMFISRTYAINFKQKFRCLFF